MRNVPVSHAWDRMTVRQRRAALRIIGVRREDVDVWARDAWSGIDDPMRGKLRARWMGNRATRNPQKWPAGKYRVEKIDHGSRQLQIRTPKGAFHFYAMVPYRMSQIITASERGDSDQVRYLLNLSGTYSDTGAANPRKEGRMTPKRKRRKPGAYYQVLAKKATRQAGWESVGTFMGVTKAREAARRASRSPDRDVRIKYQRADYERYFAGWKVPKKPGAVRPNKKKRSAHSPAACNNPRHAHRNPGLAAIMDKREVAKARGFA